MSLELEEEDLAALGFQRTENWHLAVQAAEAYAKKLARKRKAPFLSQCKVCAMRFETVQHRRKFCSQRCRDKTRGARNLAKGLTYSGLPRRRRPGTYLKRKARIAVQFVCADCGKKAVANRPNRKRFCKPACRWRFHYGKAA